MLAFALSLALILFWLLIGSAVVRPLIASRSVVQDLLLSPVIGFGVTVLAVFFVNRLGYPVARFGPALTIILFVAAAAIHAVRFHRTRTAAGSALPLQADARPLHRRLLDPRHELLRYLPFLAVLVVAAFLTGRPMLTWGFHWVSFCNDDMANYCLSADRFLRLGFAHPPLTDDLLAGKDWTQPGWWLYVPMMVRPGSELVLAWVSSTVSLDSQQAFMPMIVALHVLLVSATAGLVYRDEGYRTPALLAALLTAGCAQLTFGTVYQLIAQAIGLALLCTNLTLICRTFELPRGELIRHGLLAGIGFSAQLLTYPEVNPFLAGGFVFYTAAGLIRRRIAVRKLLLAIAVGLVPALLLLNTYLYDALAFMLTQRTQAQSGGDVSTTLFPFFLVPAGLSNFWGFTSLASMPETNRFWLIAFNISIAVGGLLLIVTLLCAVRLTWRGDAIGGVCMVCLLLAIYLFKIDAGFGLYKLAMFAQPFVLGTLAVGWWLLVRRRWWLVPGVLLLLVPSVRIQARYVAYSQDQGTTFSEIRGATRSHLVEEFRREVVAKAWQESVRRGGTPPTLICDPYNVSLSKLMVLHTHGIPTSIPASPYFVRSMRPSELPDLARPEVIKKAWEYVAVTNSTVQEKRFEFQPQKPGSDSALFFYVSAGGRRATAPVDPPDAWVVATTPRTNLLNRRRMIERDVHEGRLRIRYPEENFRIIPLADAHNFLLATASDKSQPYFNAGNPTYIALYQIESDPQYFSRDSMAGVGPYVLFEVLNPDESFRLCMEFSATMKADRENRLPPATAVGDSREPFPLVGRGAARVFSPLIRPQKVGDRWFVGIDMGALGVTFPSERPYLQGLYGKRVTLDRRRLVGFARDISAVTEAEYRKLAPPSAIATWAGADSDLRHPDLEYSGFYEDGWMAEAAFVHLTAPAGNARLQMKGLVPGGPGFEGFATSLTLLVDGRPTPYTVVQNNIARAGDGPIPSGLFDLYADLPPGPSGVRRIELKSSDSRRLAAPDFRPAGIQFTYIGLSAAPPATGTAKQ